MVKFCSWSKVLRGSLWGNHSGRVLTGSHAGHSTDHLDAKKAGELSTLFDVGGIFGEFKAGSLVSSALSRT